MSELLPVVLDCGTSLIKAGLAGVSKPSIVSPTVVAYPTSTNVNNRHSLLEDLDYLTGYGALQAVNNNRSSTTYTTSYPMKQGVITDFDAMERLWIDTIFNKLKITPSEQDFILTEPPLNSPENREVTAEIMFETLGVAGLHIGIQAVLSLYGSYAAALKDGNTTGAISRSLTGVVIDSGDGCTHVCPVADGYVLGSSIRSIPIAGRNVTDIITTALRDRREPLPRSFQQADDIARRIKESFAYVCGDVVKECDKYDKNPDKYKQLYEGTDATTGQSLMIQVAEERFLGPEIFFNPISFGTKYEHTPSLPQLVDEAVQNCPIDTRRALYGNITLSGGSTMFKNFDIRLEREVQRLVNMRTSGVDVGVNSHAMQRYAVWFGASVLGMTPGFKKLVISKAEYEEEGPRLVRNSPVYTEF